MGNALTPPTRSRAFDVNADAPLSDRDAWAIATAWNERIANFVWLSGERAQGERPLLDTGARRSPLRARFDASFSLVERIEYVDFSFSWIKGKPLERTVLAARAATIAWFALSCCPGFSGRENPAFWCRVFAALDAPSASYTPPDDDDWTRRHVVAARRFFPRPDWPFPRIRVRGSDPETLRYFFHGVESAQRPLQAITETLASALRALAPLIRDAQWERTLPMTVCTSDLLTVLAFLRSSPSPLRQPTFTVPQLQLTEVHWLSEDYVNPTQRNC